MIRIYPSFSKVDRKRLKELIEESFERRLVVDYFDYTKPEFIIACQEGREYLGAIVAEKPNDFYYMDKFVVGPGFQDERVGSWMWSKLEELCGGTGFCWRSRKDNEILDFFHKVSEGHLERGKWLVFWKNLKKGKIDNAVGYALSKKETLAEKIRIKKHKGGYRMKHEDVAVLLKARPYFAAFRGKDIVIGVDSALMADEGSLDAICEDVAFLNIVGIRPVLVHGAKYRDPREYAALLSGIKKYGASAVELAGVSADMIDAKRANVKQRKGALPEGDIESIDVKILNEVLAHGYVPVVSSLGADQDGRAYVVNEDATAGRIAVALDAEKLVYLATVPGIKRDLRKKSSRQISYMDTDELKEMLEAKKIGEDLLYKTTSCVYAVENGVTRSHIIDGTVRHNLLRELFTSRGTGTMITSPAEKVEYESVELGIKTVQSAQCGGATALTCR